jgi:hypothetical protein
MLDKASQGTSSNQGNETDSGRRIGAGDRQLLLSVTMKADSVRADSVDRATRWCDMAQRVVAEVA